MHLWLHLCCENLTYHVMRCVGSQWCWGAEDMIRGTIPFKGWLNLGWLSLLPILLTHSRVKIRKSSLPYVREDSLLKKLLTCIIHHWRRVFFVCIMYLYFLFHWVFLSVLFCCVVLHVYPSNSFKISYTWLYDYNDFSWLCDSCNWPSWPMLDIY